MNPLYEFPLVSRSKYNQTICCGVAAFVLSDSAASLTGYVTSTATPEEKQQTKKQPTGTETGVQNGPALPENFL